MQDTLSLSPASSGCYVPLWTLLLLLDLLWRLSSYRNIIVKPITIRMIIAIPRMSLPSSFIISPILSDGFCLSVLVPIARNQRKNVRTKRKAIIILGSWCKSPTCINAYSKSKRKGQLTLAVPLIDLRLLVASLIEALLLALLLIPYWRIHYRTSSGVLLAFYFLVLSYCLVYILLPFILVVSLLLSFASFSVMPLFFLTRSIISALLFAFTMLKIGWKTSCGAVPSFISFTSSIRFPFALHNASSPASVNILSTIFTSNQ